MDSFFSNHNQCFHQQQQPQQQQQQQQFPTTPSPRPLQGPRPAPLRVSKDSYKIKKPPTAPASEAAPANHPPQQRPPRQPVIIYAVSPKVIHAKPSEFMSIVQRLTGVNSSSSAAPPSPPGFPSPGGAISPAAKLATIERAQRPPEHSGKLRPLVEDVDIIDRGVNGGGGAGVGAGGATPFAQSSFTGILSPNPASLPEISPNLFSSGMELNSLGFLYEMSSGLSPAVNNVNGRNFADNTFLTSPTFGLTPTIPSPGCWDFFNL